MTVRRSRGWLVGVGLWVGCSAGTPGTKPVVNVPWGEPGSGVASAIRARWAYTPSAPHRLLGRMKLEGGREVYVGRKGERWLVSEGGEALAAGDLAEQDLIAVARGAGGSWLFVGEAGTIFEADEPLGPFLRAVEMPEPVARVEAGPQGLLAVTQRGQLLRSSDGGASFSRVPVDAPFVGDVRMLEEGKGLLLSYPERLHETADGGLTWKPLGAVPVGAQRLQRTGDDQVLVQGTLTSLVWRPGSAPRGSRAALEETALQLPGGLSASLDADLVALGMGFWRGDQVVSARAPDKRGGLWMLAVGRVGQRVEATPLEGTEGCQRLALDGNELGMVAACATSVKGARLASVKMLRYPAAGGNPEVLDSTLEGPLGETRVALGRDGRVLVWGACRAGAERAACDSESALLLPRWVTSGGEGGASPWLSVAIPGQSGRPVAARFGAGTRAYMVAQRGKTRDLGLFVSHDGGRSFEGRELGLAGALGESERRLLTGLRTASLSTSDEGIVSLAFEGQFGALVAVTDEDGRVLSVSPAPVTTASTRIGLAGRRMLAVDGASAFESLDGGVSWTALGEVPSLRCPERGSCERRVACAPAGCVVGDTVSRIGWGGEAGGRRSASAEPPGLSLGSLRPPPPVVCRLSREKWAPLPRGSELPQASDADRGKVPWALTASNLATGQVTSVQLSPSGKIDEVALLPAVRDPSKVAMHVSSSQIEGVAAVRAELVGAADNPAFGRVEVVWTNHFEGKVGRGTLPVARGRFAQIEPSLGQIPGLVVPMVSITNGGVFVRFDQGGGAEMFFVEPRGKVERSVVPAIPTQELSGEPLSLREEAVRVEGKTLPIAYQEGLLVDLRNASNPSAMALFPAGSSPFQATSNISFSYLNGSPFLVHVGQIPRLGVSQISLFPFQTGASLLGPRLAGPTQRALLDRYRPCAAADRGKTPRVVAPADNGARRGVLVEGPDGSPFASLVSGSMVMYGTSESPCGSVLEGLSVQEDSAERALVFLGDLEHGWFFRMGVNSTLEARAMSCKLSPGTMLPLEVQTAIDQLSIGGPLRPARRPPPRPVRIRP